MIGILFGLALWCPSILGFGVALRWAAGDAAFRRNERPTLLDAVAGAFALSVLANALNFFVPLDRAASACALVAGWILFATAVRGVIAFGARDVLLWIAMAVAAALACSQPVHYNFDAALYHLQLMKWMQASPIVTGLANLHERLGFNSAWLSASALVRDPFDAAPLEHAILLPAAALLFAGAALVRIVANWHDGRLSRRVAAVGVLGFVSATFAAALGSPAQDVVVLAAWLIGITLFAASFEEGADTAHLTRSLVWLAAFGTTVKLSALPIWLLPAACAIHARVAPRDFWRAGLVACTAVAIWCARGVDLSGCAAFPASVTCTNSLAWSVGDRSAAASARSLMAWARVPRLVGGVQAPVDGWIRPWLRRLSVHGDLRIGAAIVLAAMLARFFGPRMTREEWRTFAWLAAPGALAIPYWLLTAPDPRFALGPILSVCAAAFATVGAPLWNSTGQRPARIALWGFVLIAIAPAALASAVVITRPLRRFGAAGLLTTPRIDMMTTPRMGISLTAAGDSVWRPLTKRDERCYLAPLPCTPESVEGLVEVRNPGGRITSFRRSR